MTNRKWDQREDESAQAYAAFCLYLNAPPHTRSLDAAYQRHYEEKHGQPKGNVKKASGRWTHWSQRHDWTERSQAYDADQQRKAMIRSVNRRQKDVEQFIQADILISQAFQRVTSRKLSAVMQQDPAEVNATELRQVALAYDTARSWLTELLGLFDDDARRISEFAFSDDEALAQRLQEESA